MVKKPKVGINDERKKVEKNIRKKSQKKLNANQNNEKKQKNEEKNAKRKAIKNKYLYLYCLFVYSYFLDNSFIFLINELYTCLGKSKCL